MNRDEVDSSIRTLIEPFNKKNVEIGEGTTFAGDLEFDSLTVMDFVAAIENTTKLAPIRIDAFWSAICASLSVLPWTVRSMWIE